MNLKPGKVEVSFGWAARLRTLLTNKGFDFKLNGQVIKSYKVIDYRANQETFQFDVENCPSEGSVIEFCGTGVSDKVGVLIDNVKVRNFDQCAKEQGIVL